ncbi:MAG: hypothetical protein KAH10_08080 [Flavobacteriales bacterium]|nr:hypothetical protein [Flavobacteriales bacterium]
MEELYTYVLKSSAVLTIFFIVYFLLLKKETFVKFNRHFLIIGIISAFALPFIKVTKIVIVNNQTDIFNIANILNSSINENIASANTYNSEKLFIILMFTYILIALLFLGRIIVNIISFYRFIKPFNKEFHEKYIYVETDIENLPFSFMNYIVFNPNNFSKSELANILNHEKEHSKQKHSYDIILIEILRAFQWINPIAWLYKKELVQNLEFLADSEAYNKLSNPREYQLTMLKSNSNGKKLLITNNFYDTLIKKRIKKLNKKKSNSMKVYKSIAVVPILILFVLNFNTEVLAQTSNDNNSDAIMQAIDTSKTKSTNKQRLSNSFNFKTNVPDPLYVLDGEIISKFKLSEIDNKTIKSMRVLKDKQATDKYGGKALYGVVEIYVNTEYTKPNIDTENVDNTYKVGLKAENVNAIEKGDSYSFNKSENSPIIYIDGKVYTKKEMDNIKPDDIESMSVFKGDKAVERYGEAGRDGVIEIVLKKKK